MSNFNPADWYWIADDGRVFASARMAVVDATDADYKAFVAAYGGANVWPKDTSGNQTLISMQDVLAPYGLFASMKDYAASVRWAKVNGGVTYQGHPIATDDQSRANISAEALAAQILGASYTGSWKCSDGTWMPIASSADMISFATAVRNYVANCFGMEESLASAASKAAVDGAAWPSTAL